MSNKVVIVGIPSEAGTHWAGQSLAPQAVLDAGLEKKLSAAGFAVEKTIPNLVADHAEAATAIKWQPSRKVSGVRNEHNAVSALRGVREELERQTSLGDFRDVTHIFIGGDCTISQPILSTFHAAAPEGARIGLIYMDGDVDLTLPAEAAAQADATGILDSMTLTHLTHRPGGLSSVVGSEFCSDAKGGPLVTPANTVLFGFDPHLPEPEHMAYLLDSGFKTFTQPTVQADAVAAAKAALDWLERVAKVDFAVLHFDVDIIDSGAFPLGNYPSYGGVEPEEAFAALKVFLASPLVRALTVTEINPNNDPDGRMVGQVVAGIEEGFKARAKVKGGKAVV